MLAKVLNDRKHLTDCYGFWLFIYFPVGVETFKSQRIFELSFLQQMSTILLRQISYLTRTQCLKGGDMKFYLVFISLRILSIILVETNINKTNYVIYEKHLPVIVSTVKGP